MNERRSIIKQIWFITIVLILSLSVLSGCSQSTNESLDETNSSLKSQTIQSNDSISETVPNETTTAKDRSEDDWKLAYIEYVRHGDGGNRSSGNYDIPWDEYTYFSLVDVDGDSIPELYRSGGFVAQGEALLTYANGKLIIIDSYASG